MGHVGKVSLQILKIFENCSSENTPEKFAQAYCKELGLAGEFIPTIAYAVRGQLAWHQTTHSFSDNPLPGKSLKFVWKEKMRCPGGTAI